MALKEYLSEKALQKRIEELALELDKIIGDQEAVLVANLTGAIFFYTDLIRKLKNKKIVLDFISTESYTGLKSGGVVKIIRDLNCDVSGKLVILIEDILDTGLTLEHIMRYIRGIHEPSDVKICVLLDKPDQRRVEVKADFVGFEIQNEFVVGYGLDYDELYRNLPYIAIYDQNQE